MNYDDIKKLIDEMGNANINELNIEFPEGMKISMKKNENGVVSNNSEVQYKKENISVSEVKHSTKDNEEEYKVIKSPMVGTFYSKSSPTAEPFVKAGDIVKKGQVLCIVEAMKLMNEIESEFDGEVVEICVKDADMVDYNMPLFKIK